VGRPHLVRAAGAHLTEQTSPTSQTEADNHFNVDQLSHDLGHRSRRSGALMVMSYGIQLVIGIAGTAVLARLLNPRDFGYLAMVSTLINLIITFREFLLTPAVYRDELNHRQASGLFWINAIASVVVALIVVASAPLLAWFFKEPHLIAMTLVMAVGVMLNMAGMIHLGLLQRSMRFGAVTVMDVGAITAGVVVGIVAAWLDAGYWALVFQQMAVWIWQSGAACILSGWRPAGWGASALRGDTEIRAMLKYGQNATAARCISFMGRNFDNVLIGHSSGALVLGLYQKAYQWAMMPFWMLYIPITSVAVSSFSRLQDDPPRYRQFVRATFLGVFGLALPATTLLGIQASRVVLFLFGPQWTDAVPMLQMLGVGAYFVAFSLVLNWLYLAEGRTAEQLRWSIIATVVLMISVYIGNFRGAIGVATALSIASAVLVPPSVWHCLRRSPVTGRDYIASAWRAAAASVLAGVLQWPFARFLPALQPLFIQLFAGCVIYGVFYVAAWIMLPGGQAAYAMFWAQLRQIRRVEPATAT
jgi:PST family polysaccharide transporter